MPTPGDPPTRLADLAEALGGARQSALLDDVEIRGLAYDSRRVTGGELFFCVGGFNRDGHDFAPEAIARGAAALVVERPLATRVPELLVASVRDAMGPIAARFNGDPARTLKVVGVTGTNGKTTTTYLLRALLEAAGIGCGLLGTVKSVIAGRERAVQRTTPEAIDLQADLRAMLDRRRRRVRDGGLLARARARARRGDPVRGRGVHEPDPGPPRLPSHDGGLLPGQAQAVRAGRRAWPCTQHRQRRRRIRPAARGRARHGRHVRGRCTRRLPRRGAAVRLRRLQLPTAHARR